jgi:hypothetical protein
LILNYLTIRPINESQVSGFGCQDLSWSKAALRGCLLMAGTEAPPKDRDASYRPYF